MGGAAFCCDPANDSAHLQVKVQHHRLTRVREVMNEMQALALAISDGGAT